jgi:hypothetical protein
MTVIQFPRQRRPLSDVRQPDPRNGDVYACESIRTTYVDGQEVETPDGFIWIHMAQGGNSASFEHGFETLAEAGIAAQQRASKTGAIFVRSAEAEART